MIIYNVTTKLESDILVNWLSWLKEVHIPATLKTGCFSDAKIFRLLQEEEAYGVTYIVQYQAESQYLYDLFIQKFSGGLRQQSIESWGNKFIAFHSAMEDVN